VKFFVPGADDKQQQEEVYEGITKFLTESHGALFSGRKIYSLRYTHDGRQYSARVGEFHALNGEPVIAILYEPNRRLYHVCTPNRGCIRGMSILVGEDSVQEYEDFESA
jgi:hypothetical protein